MGYAGPAGEEGMKSFLQTNPAAAKKFLAFDKAAASLATPPTAMPSSPMQMAEGGATSGSSADYADFLKQEYGKYSNIQYDQGALDWYGKNLAEGKVTQEQVAANLAKDAARRKAEAEAAAKTTTPVQTALPAPTPTAQTTSSQTKTKSAADYTNFLKQEFGKYDNLNFDQAALDWYGKNLAEGKVTPAQVRVNLAKDAARRAQEGYVAPPPAGSGDAASYGDFLKYHYDKYDNLNFDQAALDWYGKNLAEGKVTPAEVSANIAKDAARKAQEGVAPEPIAEGPSTTSATDLLTNFLGGAPTDEQVAKYAGLIANGLTEQDISYYLRRDFPNPTDKSVLDNFDHILGRPPTNEELDKYAEAMAGGMSYADLQNLILGDFEITDVNAIFSKVFGREPTAAEIAAFESSGASLLDYEATLQGTVTAAQDQITQAYRAIFGRNPDADGLEWYMSSFRSGTPLETILNNIAKSKEGEAINYADFEREQLFSDAQRDMAQAAYSDPTANVTTADVALMEETPGTIIDPATGQVTGTPTVTPSTIDGAETADLPENTETNTVDVTKVSDEVQQELNDLEAAKGTVSELGTVRGQLELLMEDFENDGTPPWASGAMRAAMSKMQARGLGASSMAGQAIVQAAMESALPIAMQDASTTAQFELQNLTNEQQTLIFKSQQRFAGIFSDQAAENAAKQFNASSQNQTDQFFASLQESVSRFNATQVNAVNKSNVDAENAAKQFNAQMSDMRDRFNAQNSLVIAQSNAQWRQNIATINTAAQNDANMEAAKTANAFTGAALEQLWQRERDLMAFAFTSAESALDRELSILMADKQEGLARWQANEEEKAAKGYLLTNIASKVLFGGAGSASGSGLLGGIFG